ncbi:hypothetical protein ACIA7S_28325 [Streptomyces sp. NPDC051643]|uniref:hypothetical protein n=1 Tax=Streptomyces sp. NPDC051643 TaxID=3365665 RepID=UPI0037B9A018
MPTAKPSKDESTPQPQDAAVPAAETPTEVPVEAPEPSGPKPGVYEYTHFTDSVYLHVPLTAHTATDGRPATVFDWPFGPPDDGRWAPTKKSPNQAADNMPALAPSEE